MFHRIPEALSGPGLLPGAFREAWLLSINDATGTAISAMTLIGNVWGKEAVIIDDLVNTGGTLSMAAEVLMRHGARSVHACVTHPVLAGDSVTTIKNSLLRTSSPPTQFHYLQTAPPVIKSKCLLSPLSWLRLSGGFIIKIP